MYYTEEQIDRINSLRAATPFRLYYQDNGNIWKGTANKKLTLLKVQEGIQPYNVATTIQGNTFNNSSQLVQLENNGKLPILDAGNLTNITTQANLIGTINGVNAIFISPSIFISNDVRIFVNGVKQTIINDYQLSNNNTVTFTFSPNIGETLLIEH